MLNKMNVNVQNEIRLIVRFVKLFEQLLKMKSVKLIECKKFSIFN